MNIYSKYLKRLKINMLIACLLLSVSAYAQQNAVTGTVVDGNKEPLPGVSVVIKGTQQGTITGIDGKYSVNVPNANAILQISYLGFQTQEIVVGERRVIDVTMTESATALDEVVVVGYGTQRVRDLTGSAIAVKVDDLIQVPGTSIIDALAGQVIGLGVTRADGRPGSVGELRVRASDFLAPTVGADGRNNFRFPLIVIDDVVQVDNNGEPSMDAFNRLDYSEIESMTVLKDASAAIYGSRASSGVILVKTKRGQAGKTKIDYSTRLDFSDAVSHIKVMDAYETGLFTNRMIMQQFANSEGRTDNLRFMYTGAELMAMKNLNHDWLGEAWQSAVSQRHSVTVNGGQEKVSFFAGLNYQDQGNNLGKVQNFDRWTYRTGGEIKVAAGLKLSASIAGYSSSRAEVNRQNVRVDRGPMGAMGTDNDYLPLRHMPGYIPMSVDIDGKSFWVSPWNGPWDTNNLNDANLGSNTVPTSAWNFFANQDSQSQKITDKNGYNANFSLNYDVPFIKGLSLKAIYSLSHENSTRNQVGGYYEMIRPINISDQGMHLIGDHTVWGRILTYGDPNGAAIDRKPTVEYNKITNKSEQMSFWAIYNRTFGLNDLSLTGVIERGETKGDDLQLHYQGLSRSYLGTSLSATNNPSDPPLPSRTYFLKTEAGSLSYVGRLNYKYDARYLFEFLIRSDASTKFAPENYWGVFPSSSAGWVISEESFFKNNKIGEYIDFLKFRYSLGKTGKDNATAWRWLQAYKLSGGSDGLGFGPNGGQPGSAMVPDGTANRNIKWDQSLKQNIGMDMNIIDNRLSFTVEHWKDKTKDIIMLISDDDEPIYIGAQTAEVNYGKRNAWGWEFSIRWSDKINQSLIPSWGPIRYSIGLDYGISWHETVLGQAQIPVGTAYPATAWEASDRTGWRSPGHEWGFKTWKHTSGGDGILRTQADIDKYWKYLTDLASAIGGTPSYLGIASKTDMKLGMLAYEDIRGDFDPTTGTYKGPNGVIGDGIDREQDYVQLASKRTHSIPMRINLAWGDFNFQTNLQTSWGGLTAIDQRESQGIGGSSVMWAQFTYVNDMFDPIENPNGKYPSMQVAGYGNPSDFWLVPTFRMFVRNMTFKYSLPKALLAKTKLGIDRLGFELTGNNLWDFYNPYPYKFRNMYDSPRTQYPTLRTWTLGVNATF